MTHDIRILREDQWDEMSRMLSIAFGHEPRRWEKELERPLWEPERSRGVFDGGLMVGAASSQTRRISVPGGEMPLAAVVAVGVLPTHRRRGINTALMRRQLDDFHEAGEPLAALWASEGAIYQRFGYGLAVELGQFEIERRRAELLRPPGASGSIRLTDRDDAMKAFPPVYEAVRRERPGMLDRSEGWWTSLLADPPEDRDGYSERFYAVQETLEGPGGYVTYRIKQRWSAGDGTPGPAHILEVEELMSADHTSYEALWRFVLGIDLVETVQGWKRPVDEPLRYMLTEPRRLRFTTRDAIWLRLVDARSALGARRYASEGLLTFQVRDAFCPWNEGRFALEADESGARCDPTDRDPDLGLDVSDLAAAYLGGVSFTTLAGAGRVEPAGGEALARADLMFGWQPAPWSPHIF